jgi:hypothetical protein
LPRFGGCHLFRQCFAADAEAIGDGVMHDSTSGDYVLGAEAFRHAALQAARHQARGGLPAARCC